MNTPNEVILFGLRFSKMMLHRYCDDLAATELLHRPTPKANCAAWLIGHLALSDRRVLENILATPAAQLPRLPEGFAKRFSRDEGCPQASEFGDTSMVLSV